jgi:lipopolysaccharide/colanic/teichoic acid biosynthesis glycosyltransferase
MLLLDVYYVQNLTPWLDLYVLLRTLPYMLRGRNN